MSEGAIISLQKGGKVHSLSDGSVGCDMGISWQCLNLENDTCICDIFHWAPIPRSAAFKTESSF